MNSYKKPLPPHWADRVLAWRCPAEQLEEVQGDMHELFQKWVEEWGASRARWCYAWNVLGFMRPLPARPITRPKDKIIFTPQKYSLSNSMNMLQNNFKIAFRSLQRNKAHASINMAGLALGISCCLMIFLIVRHEWSYDTFHRQADRIYRVNSKSVKDGYLSGSAPVPTAQALKQDFPEVEQATTTFFTDDGVVKVGEQLYKEKGVVYVAPAYFSILDAAWLAGNPQEALSRPNSVVLTKSIAQKYFGGTSETSIQNALGKTIRFNAKYPLQIAGILEDFPTNTDLPFKIFISWESLKGIEQGWDLTSWINTSSRINHFVLLRPGTDPRQLEKKFPAFDLKYKGPSIASKTTEVLQPLRTMHFDERFDNYNGRTVSKENMGGLILIGVFILLIACINFINLTTAQSVKRSKEVGVRKVLGADKSQLIRQFLAETSLVCVLSMLAAVGLTYLAAPPIKALLNLTFNFNPLTDGSLLAFLLLITGVVSLLAGTYPAFILSGYQPMLALKNKIMAPRGGAFSLRRSLIVVQFVIAQVLIISTIVISGQLEFFRSKPLGFNKDAIVTIPFPAESKAEINRTLRNQLEQILSIRSLSFAHFTPSSENVWWAGFTYEGADPSKELGAQLMPIDHTYLKTYGLTLLAGKNLDAQTDSSSILVNESFLKYINVVNPEAALNLQITLDTKKLRIAGVVKDFHTGTLKSGISGIIMRKMPSPNIASIKLEPQNMRQTIAQIEQTWKKAYPESFFEFEFLDETIAKFYREEVKMYKLFRLFAGIAIFISCLGLYGLVSFMAVQRTKEIGIRKVLGASVTHIVALFSKEFFILILIAFAVATPLAWYAMQAWLQNFEFRNPMGPSSFLLAMLFSLAIAGITVIYRSVKAARTNPVKNLRTE